MTANLAPTLTGVLTPNVTFEGSAPVNVFSGTPAVDDGDTGVDQNFIGLTFTIAGLEDGANELLLLDGSSISLVNGSGTLNTASFGDIGYAVSVSGVSADVTLTLPNLSASQVENLLLTVGYNNTATTPTAGGGRTVLIASLQDDGTGTDPGVDATSTSFVTSITLGGTGGSGDDSGSGSGGSGGSSSSSISINEVDVDTSGSPDTSEFIELYDGGVGSTALNNLALVLFDSTGTSYLTVDISTGTTGFGGFYTVGGSGVTGADQSFALSDAIQNGAGVVVLVNFTTDPATEFPNGTLLSSLTQSNIADSLVFSTDGTDASSLATTLGTILGDVPVVVGENDNLNAEGESVAATTDGGDVFIATTPTPGATNGGGTGGGDTVGGGGDTVSGGNSAPTITLPSAPTVNVGDTNVAIDDTIDIVDVDGVDTQTVTLTITGGTVSIDTNTGVTVTTGDGTDDSSLVFVGSEVQVDAALDSLTFTPASGVSGTGAGQIQIQVDDGAGGNDDETLTFDINGSQTFIVTTLDDEAFNNDGNDATDGAGLSLREAIGLANANSATADTIVFQPGLTGTVTLSGGELSITGDVSITGSNDSNTDAEITIDGNNASRVFTITGTDTDVTLASLTITGGNATGDGGAINVAGGNSGGNADADPVEPDESNSVTLVYSTVSGNTASGSGGGIYVGNDADAIIFSSTISGNSAGTDGGGIFASTYADISVSNATISGNIATMSGGGIRSYDGQVAVFNSTISGNTAGTDGGGLAIGGSLGLFVLSNSIVLGNSGGNDDEIVGSLATQGTNIVGVVGGDFDANGDANIDNANPTDVFANTDSNGAGVLIDNGGPVQTIALNPSTSNPALDVVDHDSLSTDANGNTREVDLGGFGNDGANTDFGDLGAFELQTVPNRAPTLGGTPADDTATEDAASAIDLSAYDVADLDGDSITLTLAVDRGTLAAAGGNGTANGVTVANSGSTSLTLQGSAADLNTFLNNTSNILFTTDLNDTTAATLTVTPNDGTVNGTADTVSVTITPADDPTTATGIPASVTAIEETATGIDLSDISFDDVDSASIIVTLTASGGTLSATSSGDVTVGGAGTGALTLSGAVADINTFLDTTTNIQYTGALNVTGNNAASINVSVDGAAPLATVNVNITSINDAPTLTATAVGGNQEVGGAPVDLFSNISVTDGDDEAVQLLRAFSISVTGVVDGADERIVLADGTVIPLINTALDLGSDPAIQVIVAGSNVVVGFVSISGLTAAEVQTQIDGLSYQNIAANPTGGARTIELSSLQDNGGTDNGGVDNASGPSNMGFDIVATVNVGANAAPIIDNLAAVSGVTVGGGAQSILVGGQISDANGADTQTVTIAVTGGTASVSASGSIALGDITDNGTSTLSFSGSLTDVNAVLGSLTFTPDGSIIGDGNNGTSLGSVTVTTNDGANPSVMAQGGFGIGEAGSLVVTSANDDVDAFDGETTLREAINFANSVANGGTTPTITFDLDPSTDGAQGGTIVLGGTHISITDAVNINGDVDGDGNGDVTIDANDDSRVFDITVGGTYDVDDAGNSDLDVTFTGLTITGGNTDASSDEGGGSGEGGGIRSVGNVTLVGSTVTNNATTSDEGEGGGVISLGTLTLNNSTVSNNSTAGTGAEGGGISGVDVVLTNNSSVSNNSTAGSDSPGGGIIAGNSVTITNSTVSGNSTVGSDGGGIYLSYGGTVTLTNSTVSGNSANGSGSRGGGILAGADPQNAGASGNVTLTGSTISGNTANDDGGGIYANGDVDVTDSTISGNTSATDGGGIAVNGNVDLVNSTVSDNTAGDDGGGIYTNNSGSHNIIITGSTISGNTANDDGGGVYSSTGSIVTTNATIANNTATNGHGGGIYGNEVTLTNSTIVNNTADLGGGLRSYGDATLTNTIIVNNTGTNGGGGIITSHGNLILNTSIVTDNAGLGEGITVVGDITDTGSVTTGNADDIFVTDGNGDPLLTDNGGDVQTIALNPSPLNPALDAGLDGQAGSTDAAGNTREVDLAVDNGGNVDLGAVELQILPNTAPTIALPTAPIVGEDSAAVDIADDIQITDLDGNDQTVTLTITGGTASLGTTTGLSGLSGNGTASISFSGALADVNVALDSLTFTPGAGESGVDAGSIQIQTNDGAGSTADQTVTFDIAPTLTVTTNLDTGDDATIGASLAADEADGDGLSIREALHHATDGSTINFDGSVFTGGSANTITLSGTELSITDKALTIDGDVDGDGTADVTLSGNNASRVLSTSGDDADLTLNGLIITQGAGEYGGGIYALNGAVTLTNSTISDNTSTFNGGGIYALHGAVTLTNSTISDNTSTKYGGGIHARDGAITLTNSTISGNTAAEGGGIYARYGTAVTLTNSTISGNTSTDRGGGIYARYGAVTLTNSTISGNTSTAGGGIRARNGDITLTNSIVLGNSATFYAEIYGSIGTNTNSITSGDATLVFASTTTIAGTSVQAGVLADNGGPVETIALHPDPSNPALDVGTAPTGVTTDANGNSRDVDVPGVNNDGTVDAGAVEVQLTPTITLPAAPVVAEGATNVAIADDIQINDLDSDDQTVTLTITGGTASLATTGLTFTTGNGTNDASMVFSGTLADVNTALDSLTFTPTDNLGDPASIRIQITDNDGSADETLNFTITEAGGLVVTSNTDVVDATDGLTSLREAINFANSQAGTDTITFDGTVFTGGDASLIRLTEGELVITEAVNITGGASQNIIITADANDDDVTETGTHITDVSASSFAQLDDNSRVFNITGSSSDVTLSNLTITGGRTIEAGVGGAGVRSQGALTLSNVTVSGNASDGTSSWGAGIRAFNTLVLNDSTVSGNEVSSGQGGGISALNASITLNNSTVSDNYANNGSGGINASGSSSVSLNDSTVTDNETYGRGGGIRADSGTVTISGSTVSGNTAANGGGVYTGDNITLTNSTVSGNTASNIGGGLYSNGGSIYITGGTISGNTASSNGGGIYLTSAGSVSLTNSIVLGNTAGGSSDEIRGTVNVANGGNIVGANNTDFDASGDANIDNADPALVFETVSNGAGVLADNGGDVQTIALNPSPLNPALDAGLDGQAGSTDAAGNTREVDLTIDNGGNVDLGAVELQILPNSVPTITLPSAPVVNENLANIAIDDTIQITDDDGEAQTVTLTATGGTISLGATTGLNFTTGDGTDDGTITFDGNLDDINTALDSLTFTPTPDATGAASIRIQSNDDEGANDDETLNFNIVETVTVTSNSDSGDDATTQGTLALDADDGGGLSLREAIHHAEDNAFINFDGTVFTGGVNSVIRLTDTLSFDGKTVTIDGSAGTDVVISGDVDGDDTTFSDTSITDLANTADTALDDNVQVFNVRPDSGDETVAGNLNLSNLTITGGSSARGGGIDIEGGSISLTNTTIRGNQATGDGAVGGGIYVRNGNETTITNSTIANNRAIGSTADGGGLNVTIGDATITGSTFANNSAGGDGGGASVSGSVTLVNSTIADNAAQNGGGGGIYAGNNVTATNSTITGNTAAGNGGGLYADDHLVLTNSIILGNYSNDGFNELAGSTVSFYGTNLISASPIGFLASSVASVEIANPAAVFANTAEVGSTGVIAGVLADNGGPVETVALNPSTSNPAIDVGTNTTGSTTDANGNSRDVDAPGVNNGGTVDAGAVEAQLTPLITLPEAPVADAGATDVAVDDAIQISDLENDDQTVSLTITGGTASIDVTGSGVTIQNASGTTGDGTDDASIEFTGTLVQVNAALDSLTFTPSGNALDPASIRIQTTDDDGNADETLNFNIAEADSLIVTSANDDVDPLDGETTLREAINFANETPNGGTIPTITFDEAIFPTNVIETVIRLSGTELLITEAVNIDGGNSDIVITGDAEGDDAIEAGTTSITDVSESNTDQLADNSRVFYINGGADGTILNNLTITGGHTDTENGHGGGILAESDLTISNSTISGNSTSGNFADGGGIAALDPITVLNSTISGNSTSGNFADGGGIYGEEDITLTNTTISGNFTSGSGASGGGVSVRTGATIINSTISGNSAGGSYGGGLNTLGGTFFLTNSIVLGNTSRGTRPNEIHGDVTGRGLNIVGANYNAFDVEYVSNVDNADPADVFASTDSNGAGVLGSNGTIALNPSRDNPAIDRGTPQSGVTTDALGNTRDVDQVRAGNEGANTVDLGAVELQAGTFPNAAPEITLPAAPSVDQNDTNVAIADDIRITDPDNDNQTVTLTITGGTASLGTTTGLSGLSGNGTASISFSGALADVNVALDSLTFTPTTDVSGTDAGSIQIQTDDGNGGNGDETITFDITPTLTVTTNLDTGDDATTQSSLAADASDGGGLSIREALHHATDGSTINFDLDQTTAGAQGGTITLGGFELRVENSITIDGDVDGDGNGDVTIDANDASRVFLITADVASTETVSLNGLTITGGNADGDGGGIHTNDGNIALTNSTISGNMAGDDGGGIYSYQGNVTLTNSTISGNTASGEGGGIYAYEGNVTLTNSTISGNTTSFDGGGIYAYEGNVTLTNSTISGNTASFDGGGIYVVDGRLNLINSIVLGNTAASDAEISGTIGTNTDSITSGNATLVFASTTTIAGTSVQAGVLADNGGSVETIALRVAPNNPALDAGAPVDGVTTDARGNARGIDLENIGSNTDTVDLGAFEVQTEEGVAEDGFIAGALVFADADGDGVYDSGSEVATTTDAAGNFTLASGATGQIILQGGINPLTNGQARDITTGLDFNGTLSAPAGSTVVTPLTTLINQIAGSGASQADIDAAETAVGNAFGISSSVDLTSFSPLTTAITATGAEAETAAQVFAAGSQVLSTVVLVGSAVEGASGNSNAQDEAIAALADTISNAGGGAVDLTDTTTVTNVLTAAATANGTTVDAGVASTTVSIATGTNSAAQTAVGGGGSVVARLTEVTQSAIVAQGDAATTVESAAGGDATAASDAQTNFVTNLNTAITNAASSVGTVEPDLNLTGTAGAETLSGAGGDDTLKGLAGTDTLTGGGGDDRFIIADNSSDIITDFDGANGDRIDLTATDTFSLQAAQSGADTVVTLGNGESLRLQNFTATDLQSSFFTFDTNAAPTASGATINQTGTGAITLTLANIGFADSDSDSLSSVTITNISGITSGTLALNGTAVTAGQQISPSDISGGNLVFTPSATGNFSFNFTVSDGFVSSAAATVNFTLSAPVVSTPSTPSTPTPVVIQGNDDDTVPGTLSGGSTNDRLRGGGGDDTLSGGSGGDTLVGGAGSDFVSAGTGNDFIFAGANDDGDDTVQGNSGNDVIGGGAGDDIIVGGSFGTTTSNTNAGNSGDDTLFGGAGNDLLIGGSYNSATSTVVNTGQGNNTIWAGTGNDTVFGDDVDDAVGGGEGNDRLNAGGGNDQLFGGRGDGQDTLEAGAGNDAGFAGGGNDSLDGGDGDDTLFGGAGDDTVSGGAGADEIWAGGGNDDLSGGAGADTFIFGQNSGNDTVSDFDASEDVLNLEFATTDFTSLAEVTAAASETTQDGQAGVLIDLGGSQSVFIQGINLSDLTTTNVSF